MEKDYAAPQAALHKLKAARRLGQTVYLYGATGYGKTELVRRYLASRRYTYLSCGEGAWEEAALPAPPKEIKEDAPCSVVVIDDLHRLKEEAGQKKVLSLLGRKDVWLFLISRSQVPPWLLPAYLQTGFLVIPEEDLRLKAPEAAALLARFGVEAEERVLTRLAEDSRGNACVLGIAARLMAQGVKPGPELSAAVTRLFSDYLENAVLGEWEPELLEFLMQVSVTDSFDLSLAEMISGSRQAVRLLREAAQAGNFLAEENGVYRLRPILLEALRRRAAACGEDMVRECASNAGLYYEMQGRIPEALAMFEKSGSTARIRELLVRNARCNPGNGHYFELRKYYFRLKPEEIEGSVILMAAMSMLNSLMLRPEESEYWYEKLSAYEKRVGGGERQEAKSRLAYLDIALPHRGSKGMLSIMKKLPALLLDKGIGLPEFSVTSNLPSTMNGGKDFCHWSKNDRELAATMGKLVSRILGRYGKGLVNAALGESLYEKGGDSYEILTLLTRAEMEAMSGAMEVAFAAVGIKVRMYGCNGDMDTAKMQLASFEERVREESAFQLLPNIEALRCRMALYEGDKEAVRQWMETAPDEDKEFYILERYRYLTKVRCYISNGDYLKALALLEKLKYYAEVCERTYIRMETGLLTAVIRSRMGEEWKPELTAVLREACDYRFLRLIAEEGPAVSGLLRQMQKDCLADEEIDSGWLERLTEETDRMAVRYPAYLKRQLSAALDFPENALAILRLQAEGLSVTQIARRLSMKVETVRYHTKENYRKLGVSGKADAVLVARSLNLL